ncbi:MAG TPA: hypothetical protein VNG51_19185 [Ktedonobacteraceae bacterium]|nr:hypothetical protein [Ktedonobacteraceae bacterium]
MDEQYRHDTYEKMFLSLYSYRLGAISFLELIAQLEDALDIGQALDERQGMDEDVARVGAE